MTHEQIAAIYSDAALGALVSGWAAQYQWRNRWNAAKVELERRRSPKKEAKPPDDSPPWDVPKED